MMSFSKFAALGCLISLAAVGVSSPSISSTAVRAYHAAITQANQGQTDRATATLNCLLMPRPLTVGLGTSGAMARAVDRSVAVWADRLESTPFEFTSDPNPDLKVIFVSNIAQGGDVQGEVHCKRQVYWGGVQSRYRVKGTILIRNNVDGRRITATEACSVIEHELGHVLGLDDDANPGRLMGPFVAGEPVDGPVPEEVATVSAFRDAVQDVLRQVTRHQSLLNSRGAGLRGHRRTYHVKHTA